MVRLQLLPQILQFVAVAVCEKCFKFSLSIMLERSKFRLFA